MSAVTYSNQTVKDFLDQSEEVVALKAPWDTQPQAGRYFLSWTPYLLVLDPEGNVHQRAIGFHGPGELIPWVLLGAGRADFFRERWKEALTALDKLITLHGRSNAAPQARYMRAVCRYRLGQDRQVLKAMHQEIIDNHPGSIWVERTLPYLKL